MIKKTIKYVDFNLRETTQDYYFHLSKVDMVELSIDGKFEEKIKRAAATNDRLTIFREFKRLISMSVGMRSEDGSNFIRTEAFTNAFLSSPAFDELIMELFMSEDQGTAFIKGLLPANMQKDMEKELAKKERDSVTSATNENEFEESVNPFLEEPAWIKENREPTGLELRNMTREQLQELWTRKASNDQS